jgi:hypothetical protein
MIKIEDVLIGKTGGYVNIYAKADSNKKEQHILAAQVLADKGHKVELLPEIDYKDIAERLLYFPEFELDNRSNPDIRLNGILGDFKIPDSNPVGVSQIKNAIKSTAKKQVSICVLSLLNKKYSNQAVLSQIRGSLKFDNDNKSIREVWIIFNDTSLMRIPRKLTQHKNFYKLIETF